MHYISGIHNKKKNLNNSLIKNNKNKCSVSLDQNMRNIIIVHHQLKYAGRLVTEIISGLFCAPLNPQLSTDTLRDKDNITEFKSGLKSILFRQ